jgi:hypothetical protein
MTLRFRSSIYVLALFSVLSRLLAADLTALNKGRTVHLAMIGQGPLCDAKVDARSPDVLTVRLVKTTPACGKKGELIRISKERAMDIAPEERLTKGRVAAKILLGLAGVAALTAIPLTSSDPESWLLVANGVVPASIVYGAWKAVPRRRDFAILLTCTDSLHCFSDADRR